MCGFLHQIGILRNVYFQCLKHCAFVVIFETNKDFFVLHSTFAPTTKAGAPDDIDEILLYHRGTVDQLLVRCKLRKKCCNPPANFLHS